MVGEDVNGIVFQVFRVATLVPWLGFPSSKIIPSECIVWDCRGGAGGQIRSQHYQIPVSASAKALVEKDRQQSLEILKMLKTSWL